MSDSFEGSAQKLPLRGEDGNASIITNIPRRADYTTKITARFMLTLKANGVTVAMQRMKG